MLRELVPRAEELAIVAAEDAIAESAAKPFGNGSGIRDREPGDAATRIEHIGRNDGFCRTDVDAAATAAAVIRRRRIRRKRQVREDLPDEEPRPGPAVDEIGVL